MLEEDMKLPSKANPIAAPPTCAVIVGLLAMTAGTSRAEITLTKTTCEYAAAPLGVETPDPRFGWVMGSDRRGEKQAAFQILVASTREKLDADIGDKWDSGKVTSEESVNVAYRGRPLGSGERCFWKVRCWDRDGRAGPYSRPALFEMGLLKQEDWKGKWIGMGDSGEGPAPLLRRSFRIDKPVKRARAYVSGLGWYELHINGRKVGDRVLDPAMTDYSKRVLYVVHDITDRLVQGANTIGVTLGNGWYSNRKHFAEYGKWGDSPRLLLQVEIEFADGSGIFIPSDESWKASAGPILRNDLYGGETYDARLEKPGWTAGDYDDSAWAHAAAKKAPGGKLESQLMPPMEAIETIQPVKLTNPKPGIYVYDMGQLFAGFTELRVKGPAGTKVTIRYSERILADSGLLDERIFYYPGLKSADEYILKGDPQGERYSPTFAFHPVRYVQLEGFPGTPALGDLTGVVVHGAEDLSGDFRCSRDLLNRIHRNAVWTLRNALYGMPMDCLYREPISTIYVSGVYSVLNTRKHMPLFWTKWLRDVADSQDEKGSISAIAPCYSVSQFDTAFGGIYPVLVWYFHEYYGDDRILEEHYAGMKKLMDYIETLAPDHLVLKGTYGDHMVPGESPGKEEYISKETPPPLVWTAYYHLDARVMAKAAAVLGRTEDARHYEGLAGEIEEAFNAKWLDRERSLYAAGTQAANAIPLAIGLVPEGNREGVMANVVKDIVEKYGGRFHAGDIGLTCLIDTLPEHGQGELLYALATATTYPGWGYMVEQGATTIWESWGRSWPGNPRERHESMIMFCSIEKFFYQDLTGIRGPSFHARRSTPPGFRRIAIRPFVPRDLKSASASIETIRGKVASSWRRAGDSIVLEVEIPVSSKAAVGVPKLGLRDVVVEEGGGLVWHEGSYVTGIPGVTGAAQSADHVTFEVGSGRYAFKLSAAGKPPSEE
jgi:alpha-L-rhamnosidase